MVVFHSYVSLPDGTQCTRIILNGCAGDEGLLGKLLVSSPGLHPAPYHHLVENVEHLVAPGPEGLAMKSR